MKSTKLLFVLFLVLLATLCFSLCFPLPITAESFKEGAGACTADRQSELQGNVQSVLQQPIVNSDNIVVDSSVVFNDVKKVINDGKYSNCTQQSDLQKIIDSNPQPTAALPALKSYYNSNKS
jgi:hypothetical protein